MRTIRYSKTSLDQLTDLLAQGEPRFGTQVVARKQTLVYACIHNHLASFPASRTRDPDLGLHIYPVTKTPFLLVYDFDDNELRIHFVLHARADRSRINLADIEW